MTNLRVLTVMVLSLALVYKSRTLAECILSSWRRCSHACYDLYPTSQSGEYVFTTLRGRKMKVWCSFHIDSIVTYFPKSSIRKMKTVDLRPHWNINSEVDIVAKWSNGKQTESTLRQITSYSNVPLRFMINEYTDYNRPQHAHIGPYLYLGFIPKANAASRTTQGYKTNGVDRTFTNCDSNPNSYFVFYTDPNNHAKKTSRTNMPHHFMSQWANGAKEISFTEHLPDDYFFETEIHFGGCGGLIRPNAWADLHGLALGIKHTYG